MEYKSKAAIKSIGVVAPLIAMLVIALNMFGVDVSNDVAGLPEKIASVIDQLVALSGIALGVWGRVRATKEISGVFKSKPPGQ